jgi:hypothetical protein
MSFDLHLFKPVPTERLLAAVSFTERRHASRAVLAAAV